MKIYAIANRALTPLLAVLLGAAALHADPMVTGSIGFNASAKVNTNKLSTATEITSISNVTVAAETQTGSYATVPANQGPVTFTAIDSFSTIVGPLLTSPLWKFTYDGKTYSFTATSITLDFKSAGFLDISGMGYADITGYAQTAGDWSIDLTSATGNSSVKFVFGADSYIPAVADSGTTAGLLGVGLAGVAAGVILRRRRAVVA